MADTPKEEDPKKNTGEKSKPEIIIDASKFVALDNLADIKKYLDDGTIKDINITDDKGNTVLLTNAAKGNLDIIKYLLEHVPPAEVNKKNNDGNTPLNLAVIAGNLRDVKLLLNVVDDFYKNNNSMIVISDYQKSITDSSKKKWRNYITKNFSKKKGKFIVESLMQSWDTWDNYALCVIYLFFIEKTFSKVLEPYLQILVEYISVLPHERMSIGDFYNKIYTLVDMHFEDLPTIDHGKYIEKYKTQVDHNSRLENAIYTLFFGKGK